MAGPGRPSKLTRAKQAKLVSLLKKGNYLETAAACAGLDAITVRRWVKRGVREMDRRDEGHDANDAEEVYVRFARRVLVAEATVESGRVDQLVQAGEEDWHAALAFLERKYPKRWGNKFNVTVEMELESFLDKLEGNLDSETFDRVLRAANAQGPAEAED